MVVFRVCFVDPFSFRPQYIDRCLSGGRHRTFISPWLIWGEGRGQQAPSHQGPIPRVRLASCLTLVLPVQCHGGHAQRCPPLGFMLGCHRLTTVGKFFNKALHIFIFAPLPLQNYVTNLATRVLLLILLMMQIRNENVWPWPRPLGKRRNL